jgi:hypothetical protein
MTPGGRDDTHQKRVFPIEQERKARVPDLLMKKRVCRGPSGTDMDQLEPQPTGSQKTEPTPAQVDPKVYDEYAGRYGLAGMAIVITKEADRLMGQVTGQPQFELLPESESRFLIKGEDPPIPLTP